MRVFVRLLAFPLIMGLVSAQDFRIPTDLMLSGISEPVEKIIYTYQKYDTDHQKFKVFETQTDYYTQNMKQLSTRTTFEDGMISDFTYITYNDYRDGERLLTHSTVNYRDLKNELNKNRIADFTAGDLLAEVTIAPFVTTESWQDTYTVILDQGYGPIANIYSDSFEKIELNNLEEDEGFRLQFLYQHLDDVGVFQEIYEEREGKGATLDKHSYFVPLEKDKHGNWTKRVLLRASSFDPDETITSQNILENADYIEYREIYYQ